VEQQNRQKKGDMRHLDPQSVDRNLESSAYSDYNSEKERQLQRELWAPKESS